MSALGWSPVWQDKQRFYKSHVKQPSIKSEHFLHMGAPTSTYRFIQGQWDPQLSTTNYLFNKVLHEEHLFEYLSVQVKHL